MKYHKHQPKQERICVVCGKAFTVKACRLRVKPCLCCSIDCALKQRRKEKTVVACKMCGKEMVLSPWQTEKLNKGPFCSRECYGKWRSENLGGSNAPNWKGGQEHDYGNRFWKEQRRLARERDRHICRCCGTVLDPKTRKIHVHHIVPYDMFDAPEAANSLDNLETLCVKCHMAKHKELRKSAASNSGKGRFSFVEVPDQKA